MPWQDIKGQDVIVEYLHRSVQNGRLAHALLFTGPEGVGKRATALQLAQALNCPESENGDACGRCRSCRNIAAGAHPDVQVLEPDGQTLKIDQIRERLQRDAVLKPMEGRAKVYILDPADALTVQAENSLLKILEEPPPDVTVVLITSQPYALLDTVRSRCQELRFHALVPEILGAWLQARTGCTDQTARAVAMLADGRPARALRLLDEEQQALRARVLSAAQAAEERDWFQAAQGVAQDFADLSEVVDVWLTWYRDLVILSHGAPAELLFNADRVADLQSALARESRESALDKYQAVLAAATRLGQNVNPQLVLEVLMLHLSRPAGSAA